MVGDKREISRSVAAAVGGAPSNMSDIGKRKVNIKNQHDSNKDVKARRVGGESNTDTLSRWGNANDRSGGDSERWCT